MAVINGTTMTLLLDGVRIAATKSATLNLNVDLPDATSKDSAGWAAHIQGLRSWDGSFDGLYDPSGTVNFEQLYDMIETRHSDIICEFADLTTTGGGEVFRGVASISGLTITAEMETPVTLSGSFTGNGKLNKGTVSAS